MSIFCWNLEHISAAARSARLRCLVNDEANCGRAKEMAGSVSSAERFFAQHDLATRRDDTGRRPASCCRLRAVAVIVIPPTCICKHRTCTCLIVHRRHLVHEEGRRRLHIGTWRTSNLHVVDQLLLSCWQILTMAATMS